MQKDILELKNLLQVVLHRSLIASLVVHIYTQRISAFPHSSKMPLDHMGGMCADHWNTKKSTNTQTPQRYPPSAIKSYTHHWALRIGSKKSTDTKPAPWSGNVLRCLGWISDSKFAPPPKKKKTTSRSYARECVSTLPVVDFLAIKTHH